MGERSPPRKCVQPRGLAVNLPVPEVVGGRWGGERSAWQILAEGPVEAAGVT